MHDMIGHNKKLYKNKMIFIDSMRIKLDKRDIPVISHIEYILADNKPNKALIIFADPRLNNGPGGSNDRGFPEALPGTILISILYTNCGMQICNLKLRKYLEKKNIIVSIGSACNSSNPEKGSHVLRAMNVPIELTMGTIRVSAHDNPLDDYRKLRDAILEVFEELSEICIKSK
jgi:hypothetical protein